MHEGHRNRILERAGTDPAGLQDHELVEVLLFNCIPRKNTNDIAHELLRRFGSLGEILAAERNDLLAIPGVGENTASYLACIGEAMRRVSAVEVQAEIVIDLHDFVREAAKRFEGEKAEVLELNLINRLGQITLRRRFTSHDTDKVVLSVGQINRIIANHPTNGLLVVHNHLVGAALPSAEDDDFTERLQLLCSMAGIFFYDHVIVGPTGHYSYFESNRMEEIRAKYTVGGVMKKP